MKRIYIFFFLFVSVVFIASAQGSFQLGLLPSLNINKQLPKDWALNFKAESRQTLYQNNFNYNYELTDVSILAATKILINTTIGGGYLIRIDSEEVKHRAIQQVSITKRYDNFRIAHRLSMDQTFSKHDDTEFRFRYRISSEVPLQGQTLDPAEFFLKLSNEYLNSFQGEGYDLEIRGAAFLGYTLHSDSKLELGVDYRADSFITDSMRNRFWIGFNFYFTISES